MESVYRQSSLVGNICVFASGDRARPVAIVLPSSTALQRVVEEDTVRDGSFSDLVKDERVQALVLKELQSAGRRAGLANFEIIDGVVLTAYEWTIQNVSSSIRQERKRIIDADRKTGITYGCAKVEPQEDSQALPAGTGYRLW